MDEKIEPRRVFRFWVDCDCGLSSREETSEEYALHTAKVQGFRLVDGEWLCPNCYKSTENAVDKCLS